MSYLSLFEADRLYQFAETRTIRYDRVDCPPFRAFDHQARRLFYRLGEAAEDELWHPFLHAVGKYRRSMLGAPVAFNDPAVAPLMRPDEADQFLARVKHAYPGFAAEARALSEMLFGLARAADRPLSDVVHTLLASADGRSGLIIRDSRLAGVVKDRLALRGHSRVDVLAGRDIRSNDAYYQLLVIGPAYWYADHVFSSPRAETVRIVSYRWCRSKWQPAEAFLGALTRGRTAPHDDEEDDAEVEEPWPEIDWGRILQRDTVSPEAAEPSAADIVEGRLFSLHGGLAVVLEEGESARSLVIDLEAHDEAQVQRLQTRDIVPGIFVLLRTEGGGDYVAAVADQILGERAAPYRDSQRRWKHALRTEIKASGWLATSVRLLDLGSFRADEANLRHWASESSIRTRDSADFTAIMRLIGFEDKADQYWTEMDLIFRAHLAGGQLIRRRLLERVRAADVRQLEKLGRIDFALPDAEGGRLSALRVEARSPTTYRIAASQVGRPFEAEE